MKERREPSREEIVEAVVASLEPLDYVYALWEGGAIAFDRLDRWSDIDICVDADDARVADCFPVVERALESLSPIALKLEITQTISPGYVQAFYRLDGTGEYMLVDFAVFKHTWPDKLLVREIHGKAHFHFNKGGALAIPPLDRDKVAEDIERALEFTRKRFETFSCFVSKEIGRRNFIEALALYQRLVLDSLVDVLRIKYKPVRHGFKTRYIHYDLPANVASRLQNLYFVSDEKDLKQKYSTARKWFAETLQSIDRGEIAALLRDS